MSGLDCGEVREALRALHAGRLPADEEAQLKEHLETCPACQEADQAERALTFVLETRLPRPAAPEALKQRLAALAAAPAEPSLAPKAPPVRRSPSWSARASGAVALLAAAAVVLLMVLRPGDAQQSPLLRELVNDHLRVLYAARPIEIESGGIHQVKPWFAGRLDFAPRVSFGGDDDFPLLGGAVSYVVDRKAATFVFKRRLHTITLFVFPSEGLPWPHAREQTLGQGKAELLSMRGFNVLVFRREDLGYALVSDLNARELSMLAEKLAAP